MNFYSFLPSDEWQASGVHRGAFTETRERDAPARTGGAAPISVQGKNYNVCEMWSDMLIDDDRELTDEEKLLAELIRLDQRIPGGAQIAMPLQLDHSITEITNLFSQHGLPLRDELVAELTLWRDHTEQGLNFLHHCDRLMQTVIRSVDTNSP